MDNKMKKVLLHEKQRQVEPKKLLGHSDLQSMLYKLKCYHDFTQVMKKEKQTKSDIINTRIENYDQTIQEKIRYAQVKQGIPNSKIQVSIKNPGILKESKEDIELK